VRKALASIEPFGPSARWAKQDGIRARQSGRRIEVASRPSIFSASRATVKCTHFADWTASGGQLDACWGPPVMEKNAAGAHKEQCGVAA